MLKSATTCKSMERSPDFC